MSGVVGHLDLTRGAGPLLPLRLAARWLHLGKGTVVGLGGFHLTPQKTA